MTGEQRAIRWLVAYRALMIDDGRPPRSTWRRVEPHRPFARWWTPTAHSNQVAFADANIRRFSAYHALHLDVERPELGKLSPRRPKPIGPDRKANR